MSDETPDKDNNLSPEALNELNDALEGVALQELFVQYHQMYSGMVSAGFTDKQAAGILVELMFRFMQNGET